MKPHRTRPGSKGSNSALGWLAGVACMLSYGPVLLAGCGAAVKTEPTVPKQERLDRLRQRAETIADELAELGFPLRREDITITLGGGNADRPPKEDLGPFRNPYLNSTARPFLFAYYLPIGKRVVFQERTELWLESPDNTVAHELTHAHQDQFQGGLAEYQRAHSKTLDSSISVKSLIEGEATLVAEALMLRRHGVDLSQLDRNLEGTGVGQFRTDGFGSPYTIGRNFLLEQYRAGGWAAVRQAFSKPPTSSEQLLNPSKYGRDLPRHVTLPDWPDPEEPISLVSEGPVGELFIFQLLAGILQKREDLALQGVMRARRAALGWDGDRLAVFEHVGEERVLLWRTVWDTASAAEFFSEAAMAAVRDESVDLGGKFNLRRSGLVVDMVLSEDAALRRTAVRALENHTFEFAENPDDIRSTQAALQQLDALPATLPTVQGGRWHHPLSQIAVGIPEDWEVRVKLRGMRAGVQTLFGDVRDDYQPTAEVRQRPDLFHGNALEQARSLLQEIRQSSLPVLESSVDAIPGDLSAARVRVLIEEVDDEVEAAYWLVPREGHVFELRVLFKPGTTPWVVDYFDRQLSASPPSGAIPVAATRPPRL